MYLYCAQISAHVAFVLGTLINTKPINTRNYPIFHHCFSIKFSHPIHKIPPPNYPSFFMARDFKSISVKFFSQTMNFLEKTLSYLSSLCSDPLFSSIVTLYTLILLYFPSLFLRIIFSPVLISTGIILLLLLRYGAIQRIQEEFNSTESQSQLQPSPNQNHKLSSIEIDSDSEFESGPDPKPFFADCFFEWNVRAPLEVIYEAYEGEEEDENDDVLNEKQDNDVLNEKQDKRVLGIDRHPSLSLYYPESDTDCSSDDDSPVMEDWDSPERMCFRWDEEDKGGLIEISLEGKRAMEFFHAEEDNLIEIDISPARIR